MSSQPRHTVKEIEEETHTCSHTRVRTYRKDYKSANSRQDYHNSFVQCHLKSTFKDEKPSCLQQCIQWQIFPPTEKTILKNAILCTLWPPLDYPFLENIV